MYFFRLNHDLGQFQNLYLQRQLEQFEQLEQEQLTYGYKFGYSIIHCVLTCVYTNNKILSIEKYMYGFFV